MKTVRLLLLALCLGLLPIHCCSVLTHWDFGGLALAARQGTFNEPLADGTFTSDTAKLLVSIAPLFVERGYRLSLTEPAFGTSCPEPGSDGLVDTVASVRLFSSADFNGTAAGQQLNEKVKIFGELPLTAGFFNQRSEPGFIDHELVFLEKPATGQPHTFTLRITQASGKVTDGVSAELKWK